jgi:predicted aminopeptidase
MFQGATGYFRAISVEDDAALQLYDPGAFDELVHALEAARSRLAIAVAADSKMTPLCQRKLYLETDVRLRRCLRKLRARQWPGRSGHSDWIECLESLTRLLDEAACRGRSHRMCARLVEILNRLEGGGEGATTVPEP